MSQKQVIDWRYKMIRKSMCIKQKAILFILLLISILLLTLYFQNKNTHENYLSQIENNYKKSFDNYYIFFKKRLVNFYDTQTIFIQNDKTNIAKLIKKEKFLKDIKIVDLSYQSSIYSKKVQIGKSFIDVINQDGDVVYKIISPIIKNEKIDSFIEYVLDPRVFLQSIKEFDGSNGIIYIEDNNRSKDIFLKEYLTDEITQRMAHKCQESKLDPVFEVDDNFYVKKNMLLKNYKGENIANTIFFLDVTKEKKAYISLVRDSIFTSILLFIIAAIIVNYFFNSLIKRIYANEMQLKEINKNLENLVEKETEHRLKVEKDALNEKQKSEQLLIQQSKLALLGEMIGNIAHQWRQPLMQLSAILMYLDAYNEKGKLTKEKLDKKVSDGNSIIDFMSKTIEDFRNYYKPEKQKEEFLLKDCIDSALFIVNSALKSSNIKVNTIYSKNDLTLTSYKNEFSQALLNIITNAKDILIQRDIDEPTINIEAFQKDDTIMICVNDNAGGIDEEILSKVFDPYFTTKHKSQGTGIGLYMTKMIIENNMNGSIKVENSEFGAKFIITLKI